jgi:K+-transporting ATPase ATPase C chain
MLTQFKPALIILVAFSLLTGLAYPAAVTGIAHIFFSYQANGSLVVRNGQTVGSELIGQQFSDPKYFWGRPSSTATFPYNAAASGGSNLGPTNPVLINIVSQRILALQAADPHNTESIPVDLVTASASGLDPNISIDAALYQIPRVSRERGISEDKLRTLVGEFTQGRQIGFFGEPRVNVLELNLALDALQATGSDSIK